MGYEEYPPLVERYNVPIVVTGFEPLDILQGVYLCVRQLERGEAKIENQYARAVLPAGNPRAQEIIQAVFEIGPRNWRGIGEIPSSGLRLTPEYADFDANTRFPGTVAPPIEPDTCIAGEIMQGKQKPDQCPAFGTTCTPEHPIGATMVSTEGACAAYYRYRPSPVEAAS
jgi:hydrogenase expression/formation protein HypD